ncbi:MAG TPA: GPW/gp25 family protein [Myxococcales bacterium]
MNRPPVRALRFALGAGGTGLRVAQGGLQMAEDDEALRQAILMLISTRPGERVMRPGYGCDLQRLIFAPNDDTTAGLAVHYVRRALATWEPRIDVLSLDAVREGDGTVLSINLTYRAKATLRRAELQVRFSLEQGVV